MSLPARKIAVALSFFAIPLTALSQAPATGPSQAEMRTYARLMAMTDSRTYDKALLDSAIASKWQPLRRAGALAIGQVGRAHGLPGISMLRSLLSDADTETEHDRARQHWQGGFLRLHSHDEPGRHRFVRPCAAWREGRRPLGRI